MSGKAAEEAVGAATRRPQWWDGGILSFLTLPLHTWSSHIKDILLASKSFIRVPGGGLWGVTLCFACNPIHKRISTSNVASARHSWLVTHFIWTQTMSRELSSLSFPSAKLEFDFNRLDGVNGGVTGSGDGSRARGDGRLRGRQEINTVVHICSPSVRDFSRLASFPSSPSFSIFLGSLGFWGGGPATFWPDGERFISLFTRLFTVRTVCLHNVLCTGRARSAPHFLLTGFLFFYAE